VSAGRPACLALTAPRARRARLVLASLVPLVALAPAAFLVPKGRLAARVSLGQMVATARRVRRVSLATMARTARTARLVPWAPLVVLARRDPKVTVASLSCKFTSTLSSPMST